MLMHLLADLTDFVPLIVGAIALIGWIANKVKEAGGAAGGVGADVQDAAAGNDAGRVQDEIDRFLQQVRGGVGQAAENAVERPVEPAKQPVGQLVAQPEPQAARSAESHGLSNRHVIGNRHIDTDVDDHVLEHLPKGRVADQVEEDLGHGFERSYSSRTGSAFDTDVESAEIWEDGGSGLTAEALVGLLTRPEGIRQAVVLQEILSRPKGRRGRRGRRGL
jgi:hypothetical protein